MKSDNGAAESGKDRMGERKSADRIRGTLRRHGVQARKRYGQNFLTDEEILRRIVTAAAVGEDDTVLEIGPGTGALTRLLAEAAGAVVAVEVDASLSGALTETLTDCPNVTVLYQDILKTDLRALAERYGKGAPFRVVANLPYYITTPVLLKLLEAEAPVGDMTVMVQREVAQRITAAPGSRQYGLLSVTAQYAAKAELLLEVPRTAFFPRPEVDSGVVRLTRYETPPVKPVDHVFFFEVVRAVFQHRRKTLVNGLTGETTKRIKKEEVVCALQQMSLPAGVRGETLTLSQFAMLSDLLYNKASADVL